MKVIDMTDPDMKKLKIWRSEAWNRFETAKTKEEVDAASYEILVVNARIKQLLQKRRSGDGAEDNHSNISFSSRIGSFIRSCFSGRVLHSITRQEITEKKESRHTERQKLKTLKAV